MGTPDCALTTTDGVATPPPTLRPAPLSPPPLADLPPAPSPTAATAPDSKPAELLEVVSRVGFRFEFELGFRVRVPSSADGTYLERLGSTCHT